MYIFFSCAIVLYIIFNKQLNKFLTKNLIKKHMDLIGKEKSKRVPKQTE